MKILITGGNGNIAKIIKKYLSDKYLIITKSRDELNILNYNELNEFLNLNSFDILIHTAVIGGRRGIEEDSSCVYNNLLMFENLMKFNDKFKLIINLDSAAIYDRSIDIMNRSEDEIYNIPLDFYGFSKYIIYQRTLLYKNVYNFRIFNIFHVNEESNRFIKSCFISKNNKTKVTIFEDKYFDFFYEKDFIKVLEYYIETKEILEKTINLCYGKKYKLSEIAKLIIKNENDIIIENNDSNNNYCGNNNLLKKYNINLSTLEISLIDFDQIFNTNTHHFLK
jgi:nucleoside-diphosphate-sugar epimerase